MIGTVLGKYKILEEIGAGGAATVYRAVDTAIDMEVAIKMLHENYFNKPKAVTRFLNDARTLGKLNHPNVIRINYVDIDKFYFVMELVRGVTLKQWISDHAGKNDDAKTRIAVQLCEALQYIHGQGIVHRDIKPHNIMIDSAGNLKVLDFGIAREGSSTMTADGSIMGTVEYMSPEQIGEEGNVDHRTDIYSAGMTLYEMFTGHLPFHIEEGGKESVWPLMKKIFSEPMPQPRDKNTAISKALNDVILKALHRDRAERHQTMTEMLEHLRTVKPWASFWTLRLRALRPKPVLAWSMAGTAAVLIAAGSILYFRDETASAPETSKSPRNRYDYEESLPVQKLKPGEKININTASASELKRVPGVGNTIARRIIGQRENYGRFKSINELLDVDGIKEKTFEKIKNHVTVE
ncbi:protein kinase [bacterium]|nr:protein kinase [bacterium]